MLPTIQIGPLALPMPQLSLLLAFWLGLSMAEKYSSRRGISADALYNLVFTGLIAGLIGARLGYVLQYLSVFAQSPLDIFSLNLGLLDPFSGFAFGLLGMVINGQRNKLPVWNTLDALTPLLAVMAVGLAAAHIASGESFGSETSLPWAINLWGAKRHPTQIYELAAAVSIIGLLAHQFKSTPRAGTLFLGFTAWTAAAALFLEGFHGDSLTVLGGIRTIQIFAWVALTAALLSLDIIKRKV